MAHIGNIAFNILKKLKTYNISVDDLKKIIKQQGYTIVGYDKFSNKKDVEVVLNELNLKQFSQTVKAFTYADNNYRIVFISNGLSDAETIILLAHEAGHIFLNHMSRLNGICDVNVTFENEANEFSHYLICPSFVSKVRLFLNFNRKTIILAITLIIAFIISLFAYQSVRQNTTDVNEHKTESSYEENTEEVYVTENGRKYHKKWCIYIKGKQKIKSLNISDAENDYKPCKMCFPIISE